MLRLKFPVTFVIVIAAITLGCSSGMPGPIQQDLDNPAPVQALDPGDTHLWGLFQITIDPETFKVESVPMRNVMFTANVTTFMNQNPLAMTFNINGIIPGPDYIDVDIDVGLTHPFPGMPHYNGYDVRGIFMGDGSSAMLYNPELLYPMPGVDQMMLIDEADGFGGPDGYSRWYNVREFSIGGVALFDYTHGKLASPGYSGTSTVNPYKYFADGLGTSEDLWSWMIENTDRDGQFSSGATNARNYYLRFPNDKGVTYAYAVIANWLSDLPEDHPSNTTEAVAVLVEDNSDVWFVDPSSNGGSLNLDISIFDWASEISAGVMENYDIIIESSVTGAVYYADDSVMTPVGGDENYSTYHVEISANAVTRLDDNYYWVIVEYPDSDYSNVFGAMNDAWDSPLAAFFRYELPVSNQSPCDYTLDHMNPDTADISAVLTDVEIIGEGLVVGGPLACYLSNGNVDITGTSVTFENSTMVTADFNFGAAGAEEGTYDLYFTNGDGCEEILVDAMTLVSFEWPVLIDDDESYYAARFVEDSNGIFHVFAGYEVVNGTPGEWELKWHYSEDNGQTWMSGGNIYVESGLSFTGPTGLTACASDDQGGVYVAYSEREYSTWTARPIRIAYLDTATYDDPDTWSPADWETKDGVNVDREPSGIYLACSTDGAILIYTMRYTTSTVYYNYADSFASLDASTTTILNSAYGVSNMSFQHVYLSLNNAMVYDPNTGNFYLVQAGNFDSAAPYNFNVEQGGYILEFDPDASGSKWRMETYFDHPELPLDGNMVRINHGDLTIDSSGDLHWVHQYRYPTTAYPYDIDEIQYKFIYGTNETGSWEYTDPISDNYIFPNPPDDGPNNQLWYECRAINLVAKQNNDLILTWQESITNQNFKGGTRTSGTWSDTPADLDVDSLDIYLPQGEAWGVYSAQTFTTFNYTTKTRGALYFTMTDGTQ